MTSGPVIIKKYENRRLYNTATSHYITLSEIAGLIREGAEVQVVDVKTGEDLTRVTLTQIIVEDAKDRPTGLPLELLRQLIVASDQARHDFVMWYLKSAFDTYQTVRDGLQSQFKEAQSAALAPIELMKNLFIGGKNADPVPSPESEIKELKQRISELESRLEGALPRDTLPKKPAS
jgi:polyhydroxyalkanoate synthesis repressor PhaR